MNSFIGKVLPSTLRQQNYKQFMTLLKGRISEQFINNPSIKPIKFTEENINDKGINFNVKLLQLLAKKPTGNRSSFSPLITKDNQELKDPFVAPFENGAFIDEVTDTHSLMYNKFSVCNEHTIIITKEFEKQIDPLNIDDFKATSIVLASANAFMFFNSGFNSGASIMHKHMQVIPYGSMGCDGVNTFVPVEQCAIDYIKTSKVESRMFQLPQFSAFKHIFYRIDQDFFEKSSESEEGAEEMSEKLDNYYWQCLKKLGNEEHNLDVSYNLLVTRNFLFIALRLVEAVKEDNMTVTVNSLGFAGTHAVKREEDL